MGRENLNLELDAALEVAEREMKPLALKTDHTKHFDEEFRVSEADVAVLSNKYLSLKIAGAVDKKGYALVHAGRMEVREVRTHIEKTRKRLKEESLEYGRAVDNEAKRITAMIAPVEAYLLAEETRIDNELNAIKAAEQKALNDRNQARMDALSAVGATIGLAAVVNMQDGEFKDYLVLVTNTYNERMAFEAKQAEEKARSEKAEAERLEAEKAAIAAAKAENDRIAAELKAQREEFEAKQAKANAEAWAEQDRKDAEARLAETAEKNRLEDIAIAERKAFEDEANRIADENKRLALEAARPDAEKLQLLADQFGSLLMPVMATEPGKMVLIKVTHLIDKLVIYTREQAESLVTEKQPEPANKGGLLI